jgi:hypothetical protein
MCAWEQKNYEMNKCLGLVYLTNRIGLQSGDLDQSVPRGQNLPLSAASQIVLWSSNTHCNGTVFRLEAQLPVR